MGKKPAAIPDGAVIKEEIDLDFVLIPLKKKDSHSGDDSLILRPSKIQATSITVAAKKIPQNRFLNWDKDTSFWRNARNGFDSTHIPNNPIPNARSNNRHIESKQLHHQDS